MCSGDEETNTTSPMESKLPNKPWYTPSVYSFYAAVEHRRPFTRGPELLRDKPFLVLVLSCILMISIPFHHSFLLNYFVSTTNRNLEPLQDIPSTSAIAVLVPNSDSDLLDFCVALTSLQNLPKHNSDLLVFHEGDLSENQLDAIDSCADRAVLFHTVDFQDNFPEGFDPAQEFKKGLLERGTANAGRHLGRAAFGYVQMIRFWTTRMWEHPAVQKYDTVMRIDTDSCFVRADDLELTSTENDDYKTVGLPSLASNIDYKSFLSASSPYFGVGLYDFVIDYVEKNDITPSYPKLWERIKDDWEKDERLPIMQTNLEIGRREFFQRDDVRKWHEALTEKEPFGVFRKRWGDAQTRVLTMALFGTPDTVDIEPTPGYYHGRGICSKLLGIGKEMLHEVAGVMTDKE